MPRLEALFEFKQMAQPGFRGAKRLAGVIDLRETLLGGFLLVCIREAIRMPFGRKRMEAPLQEVRIDPGRAGNVESREAIHFQALKLSPHEQLVAAFGFFTLKPPSWRESL